MKAAVERMELWDADGDSHVAQSELPTHFRLTLTRGRPGLAGGGIVQTFPAGYRSPVAGRTNGGGPIWFRKMDRNRDGDVSRREFLGSRRAFQKLDANNDEFIDAAEALTAH